MRSSRFVFLLVFFAAVPAFSQTSAGALVGLVRDSAAAVIPGATILVTNTQTNVAFSIKTEFGP